MGGGGGANEGPDLSLGGGGARGRHRNDFSPSHLLCTIKSQTGGVGGNGGYMM